MHVQKKLPKTLTILIYLASIAILAMNPACAADTAPSANAGQGMAGQGFGHHGAFNAILQEERMQSLITRLGNQGVDIARVQADLTAGNMTAVMQWLGENHQDRPIPFRNWTGMKPLKNATMQTERLQPLITRLGQQGVDISQVQTDLITGNSDAVEAWFSTYFRTHPVSPIHLTEAGSAMNVTLRTERLQSLISGLAQQGVDTAQVQADLTAKNMTAVVQWVKEYHHDHPGSAVNAPGVSGGPGTVGTGTRTFPGHQGIAGNRTATNGTAAHRGWWPDQAS